MMKSLTLIALLLLSSPTLANQTTWVVLGDSLSAGHGMAAEAAWPHLLQQKLNEAHCAVTIVNASISGETSAGGLRRLDALLAQHRPQGLLLELGANDGLRGLSPEQMRANLTDMIQRTRAQGGQVLLIGNKLPPNYGNRFVTVFFEVYQQVATATKTDLLPFLLSPVALRSDYMQPDGLHPNTKAQAVILEHVWPYLTPLLRSEGCL
ncbi:MAG: arylesterase [Methylococcales bacterium]|nr:arylesterase [Methylococcales bacterium]